MKPRTIIGIIFIVASLLKLATIWGIIHWSWFANVTESPWATYFYIFVVLYVGVNLIINSYRRDPDQWLQRPLPIGEDGKRICCSVHYGGDEYVYHGEAFHGARLDAFCGGIHLLWRHRTLRAHPCQRRGEEPQFHRWRRQSYHTHRRPTGSYPPHRRQQLLWRREREELTIENKLVQMKSETQIHRD